METNKISVGKLVEINRVNVCLNNCGSDDDCGCEGGEGSCECGYDPECEG